MILGGTGVFLNSQLTNEFAISSESAKILAKAFSPYLSGNILIDFLSNCFGAFTGAFFTFAFVILGYFLKRLYQRKVKHYNTLVFFEALFNDYLGIIHDNIYLIEPFRKAITSGKLYWSTLKLLFIDKSRLSDLLNIELINEINDYFLDVRKLNDDIEGITNGYVELKNAFIQRNIDQQTYIINAETVAENLLIINVFSDELEKNTLQILAKIRIYLRKDKLFASLLIEFFTRKKVSEIKKREMKEEIEKLKKELTTTASKSKIKIEELKKKVG